MSTRPEKNHAEHDDQTPVSSLDERTIQRPRSLREIVASRPADGPTYDESVRRIVASVLEGRPVIE
jgi:hypothetical protein